VYWHQLHACAATALHKVIEETTKNKTNNFFIATTDASQEFFPRCQTPPLPTVAIAPPASLVEIRPSERRAARRFIAGGLGAAPVFRKWNKRPNQLIIVGDAWRGSRYVLRLAALNRVFRLMADEPVPKRR
jgi:hypothetical protein